MFVTTGCLLQVDHNPRLTKTREGFVELMENLNLPYPKKISEVFFWEVANLRRDQ